MGLLFPFAAHAVKGILFWQCEHGEWVAKKDAGCSPSDSNPACKPNLWLCKDGHWNVLAKQVCAQESCSLGYASRLHKAKKHINSIDVQQAMLDVSTAMFANYAGATVDAYGKVVDADGELIDPLVYSKRRRRLHRNPLIARMMRESLRCQTS